MKIQRLKKECSEEEGAPGYGWQQDAAEGARFGVCWSVSSWGKLGDTAYLNK